MAGWWMLAGVLFGGAAATTLLLVQEAEHRFFPVVTEAQITRTEYVGASMLIWGTFTKTRDCKFIEAVARAGATSLDLEFLDSRAHQVPTRVVGPQTFGPWRITPNALPLHLTVRHSCHALWQTTSTLIEGYTP